MKVLIPTDFSDQADFAYLMAKKLQEKINVEIHFLHVMDMPGTVTVDDAGHVETCGDIDINYVNSRRDIAMTSLNNIKSKYGTNVNTHLRAGKPADQIISFVKFNQIDLVVMGTKGAWGLKEKISGSFTQMIVRQSPVPVLSMMCDRSNLAIKNILLVHNFNEPFNENLELLQVLIKAFNPKIHLLQIIDSKQERMWLLSQMDEFTKLNGITNYEKHLLNDKDVEAGVIHFNQMHDMDLICMISQSKKGIKKFIHSSEAEKLVNHLFKPIISFHLKETKV